VLEDGTVELSGLVSNPQMYGTVLDDISELDFVTEVREAALYDEEDVWTGYYFQISFSTVPREVK